MRKTFLFTLIAFGMMSFINDLKQADNTLSEKERKEGWILLFDGATMNGWRSFKNKKSEGWDVKNGELYCKEEGVKERADLITNNKYENYELLVDWRIAPKKNSGIIYMVTEENSVTFESGPEYQLIDDIGYPGKLSDKQLTGANYDMHAPTAKVARPAGEFNTTKIVINKGHVEHWLNGTKVVDYQLWTPEWEQLKANSKWKDVKPYGMSKSGHIALQDHGGGVAFKNIKLKPL
ncbi:MAG TPA: DUF1080 domain-containing protein [Chitinophagaceae bacterium]|nr:DUF1080 domain-containing protein [Chitinophagaceae bacterium]